MPKSSWFGRPRSRVAMACLAMLAGLTVQGALPNPEPDPIPRRWQLDVKVGPLRLAQLKQADGKTTRYFYMTYHVSNKTGEDILFAPGFELANDEGEVFRSGRGVSIDASDAIAKELDNPLLQDQISILGMLLQGEENSKDGLVIWPAGKLEVNDLAIYAAGFSGEVQTDSFKDEKGETKVVPLYKTLMVRYKVAGDVTARSSEPLAAYEQRWIMR